MVIYSKALSGLKMLVAICMCAFALASCTESGREALVSPPMDGGETVVFNDKKKETFLAGETVNVTNQTYWTRTWYPTAPWAVTVNNTGTTTITTVSINGVVQSLAPGQKVTKTGSGTVTATLMSSSAFTCIVSIAW